MDINLVEATPPEKVFTERSGSKYDKVINHAIDNKGTWFQVASVPVENRDSMYSTASAIRKGRLGNIPNGENINITCRRVEDRVVMFIKAL